MVLLSSRVFEIIISSRTMQLLQVGIWCSGRRRNGARREARGLMLFVVDGCVDRMVKKAGKDR